MTILVALLCAQTLKATVDIEDITFAADKDSLFEQSSPGAIVLPVRLNGLGPFKFLLDTGSTHSAISTDLADALGTSPVARAIVRSPLGEHVRTIVQINTVEIGPTVTSNVLASVIPSAAAKRMHGFQGLIGQDVLATKTYTIDFPSRRVLWHKERPAASGEVLPLEFDGGRALVTLPQRNGVLRLVPDSAAQGLVLFRHRNLPLPAWSGRDAQVEVTTLLERRNVQHVTLKEFRVGRSIVLRLPATIVPIETGERVDMADDTPVWDGLLPIHLFERVTFDGPERLLVFRRVRMAVGRSE